MFPTSLLLLGQPVVSSPWKETVFPSCSPQSQCVFHCSIVHPIPSCSAGGDLGPPGGAGEGAEPNTMCFGTVKKARKSRND